MVTPFSYLARIQDERQTPYPKKQGFEALGVKFQ